MRAQRPPGSAPVIDAVAGALPFADGAFDAAMAILSDHHWPDHDAGLRELRRVARRAVLLQWDSTGREAFWLARDYMPRWALDVPPLREAMAALGPARFEVVPIPHDCRDGFLMAYWRRPEAYLDPVVRANISVFALMPDDEEAALVAALRADLESGAWARAQRRDPRARSRSTWATGSSSRDEARRAAPAARRGAAARAGRARRRPTSCGGCSPSRRRTRAPRGSRSRARGARAAWTSPALGDDLAAARHAPPRRARGPRLAARADRRARAPADGAPAGRAGRRAGAGAAR